MLDRTAFYARGGGQPGDHGRTRSSTAPRSPIVDTLYTKDRSAVLHMAAEGCGPARAGGPRWSGRIDWPTRLARMKIHTALHLLSVVLPYPVTGGAIGDGEGRLDFDLPEGGLDRDEIAAKLAGADRRRPCRDHALDHRCRTRGEPGAREDDEGEAADGFGPRPPRRDRRRRSAALRRNPRGPHVRDRRRSR